MPNETIICCTQWYNPYNIPLIHNVDIKDVLVI